MQATNRPPIWWKRWLWRLRSRGLHLEVPVLPEGFTDGITTTTNIKCDVADRFRILIGGVVQVRNIVATQNKIGTNKPFYTSVIIVPEYQKPSV